MNGLADVDGFKIIILSALVAGLPIPVIVCALNILHAWIVCHSASANNILCCSSVCVSPKPLIVAICLDLFS